MQWKLKSAIQRTCALLPGGGEAAYFFLQRNFGTMRQAPDPLPNFNEIAPILQELRELGFDLNGKRVMEVGTGRRVDMPLAFYLCGAQSIVTFDLHRYLRAELVLGAIQAAVGNRDRVMQLFSPLTPADLLAKRLDALGSAPSLDAVLQLAQIDYRAPADASKTGLPDRSIDLQFSYTVFEHIPEAVLEAILRETSRILSPEGVACHHIDPSDHFAQDDRSISMVNFLQFEEAEWSKYSDNQFAYHNRLRAPDFERIYARANHKILKWVPFRDARSERELDAGFPLASRFRGLPADMLATVVVRCISRPKR